MFHLDMPSVDSRGRRLASVQLEARAIVGRLVRSGLGDDGRVGPVLASLLVEKLVGAFDSHGLMGGSLGMGKMQLQYISHALARARDADMDGPPRGAEASRAQVLLYQLCDVGVALNYEEDPLVGLEARACARQVRAASSHAPPHRFITSRCGAPSSGTRRVAVDSGCMGG